MMTTSGTAQIRKKLSMAFDDSVLSAFCFDYFRIVYDKFSQGMRKDDKITLLLDYCDRHPTGFQTLLDNVRKEYETSNSQREELKPLIDTLTVFITSISLPEPELKQPEPEPPPPLPFVNRQEELDRILSPLAPPYHLIDAPAGYGKTTLLKELQYRFEKQNWLCAYISLEEHGTLPSIVQALAARLKISLPQDVNKSQLGQKLADALVQQRRHEFSQKKAKEGVILLIDIDKRPRDSVQPTINFLFTDFILDVEEALHSLEFFQEHHNRFRVVFAGRYLIGKKPRSTPLRFKELKLTPFDVEVVHNTVQVYLPHQRNIGPLAAHLIYYTAGHPGCIARVLKLYEDKNCSTEEFFGTSGNDIWANIVWPEIDAIRYDIYRGLRRIFDDLSIFRYLDYIVLQKILDQVPFSEYADAFDLADLLTRTYLMDWEGRLLRDGITRRLLALRFLREIGAKTFAWHCQRAKDICAARLSDPFVQMPERWAIECLFQCLQQHTEEIQSQQKRQLIAKDFFEKELSEALQLLIKGRNPREEQTALKRALETDWEFRFIVNYYLREEEYSDAPVNALLEQIDLFFAHHQ